MFCPRCGKQSALDANFCSTCGAVIAPRNDAPRMDARYAQPSGIPLSGTRIVRPRSPRILAGVCSGIALHYDWNLTLVRILFVVVTILTHGIAVLAYIAAWILMPDAQYALPISNQRQGTSI